MSLLSLPDELLTRVTDDVASRSRWQLSALARTCRRLARIAQAQLFNDVAVLSADQLCALSIALQHRADLREKIARLRFHFVRTIEVGEESYDDMDSDEQDFRDPPHDCNIPLYECGISSLLASAPFSALSTLVLYDFPPSLLRDLLGGAGSANQLPALQKIKLVGWDDPFAATKSSSNELWSVLTVFPSLVSIELRSTALRLPSALDSTKQLRNVQTLCIGEIKALDPEAMPLADLLPGLEHLEMHGDWGVEPLRHVVPTAVSSLRSLALPEVDVGEPVPLSDFLGRFPHLEDLSLTGAWNLLPALPLLQKVRLRGLTFEGEVMEVSDELLLAVVSKLEHLRHLHLQHMRAPISGKALEEHIRSSFDWRREAHEVHEQVRHEYGPRWTDAATRDGYSAAFHIARQKGVNVTGNAVACVTWSAEFERQFELCLLEYAVKNERFAFLVEHYGVEHARDSLRWHLPTLHELLLADPSESPERGRRTIQVHSERE